MRKQLLPACLAAAVQFTPVVATGDAADLASIGRHISTMLTGKANAERARDAWDVLDSWALYELASGTSVDACNAKLQALPGWHASAGNAPSQIDNVAFYRHAPDTGVVPYAMTDLVIGSARHIVAQWSPGRGLTQGRMSVFREQHGRWEQLANHDGERELSVHTFPKSPRPDIVVTIDSRRCIDCLTSHLRYWRIQGNGLLPLRAHDEPLLDPGDPVVTNTGLALDYDRETKYLWGGFLKPRNRILLVVTVTPEGAVSSTKLLTPWIDLIDRFVLVNKPGVTPQALAPFLAAPSALTGLPRPHLLHLPHIVSHDGARAEGQGSVVLRQYGTSLDDRVDALFELCRGADRIWRIQKVTVLP